MRVAPWCWSLHALTESVHTWSSEAEDWGFTLFLPLEAALDPDKGYCLNDTLKLKAEITVELRVRGGTADRLGEVVQHVHLA